MIRIGLADACPLIRQALKDVLKGLPEFTPAWEVDDHALLVQTLRHQPIQVLVLEPFTREGSDRVRLVAEVRRAFPDTRQLVYTHAPTESFVMSALRAGAAGVLAKDCSVAELVSAMRTIASGKTYLSSAQSKQLSLRFLLKARVSGEPDTLSSREQEVLDGIAAGKRLKEIAAELFLSPKTVYTYKIRIMERFHLASNADLIRFAQIKQSDSMGVGSLLPAS